MKCTRVVCVHHIKKHPHGKIHFFKPFLFTPCSMVISAEKRHIFCSSLPLIIMSTYEYNNYIQAVRCTKRNENTFGRQPLYSRYSYILDLRYLEQYMITIFKDFLRMKLQITELINPQICRKINFLFILTSKYIFIS